MATRAKKPRVMRYITRFDHGSTHGFWVRVPGAPSKLFSDGVYGGKAAAKAAARKFRDHHAKANGLDMTHGNRGVSRCRDCRSTTGVVGVSLAQERRGEYFYYSFRARWTRWVNNRRKNVIKRFSVRSLGWKGAWESAVRARLAAIGEAIPARLPPPPRKPRDAL